MGRTRHSRPDHRLRPAVEPACRDCRGPIRGLAKDRCQQILQLEGALWSTQRTQRLDSSRSLARTLGKEGDHRFLCPKSIGRLSSAHVHDAGSEHRRCQSIQHMAGSQPSRLTPMLEQEIVVKGDGIPATVKTSRALARRRFPHQHFRNVLLPVQCSGWSQPLYRALGIARIDEGIGSRTDSAKGTREVSRRLTAHHLRQWPAVHCQGLQRIHPALWYDARQDFTVLPSVQRQDRTLASIRQTRMHSPGSALNARRCPETPYRLHRALQYCPTTQRDRLSHATRQAERTRNRNICRQRSQAGRSPTAQATTPQCFLIRRNDLIVTTDSPIHAEPRHVSLIDLKLSRSTIMSVSGV